MCSIINFFLQNLVSRTPKYVAISTEDSEMASVASHYLTLLAYRSHIINFQTTIDHDIYTHWFIYSNAFWAHYIYSSRYWKDLAPAFSDFNLYDVPEKYKQNLHM